MCEQVLNTVRQLEAKEEGLPVLAPGDKEREAEEAVERRGGIVYSRWKFKISSICDFYILI